MGLRVGSHRLPAEKAISMLPPPSDIASLRWALEVVRIHAVQHFGVALPKTPEIFSTLASLRSSSAELVHVQPATSKKSLMSTVPLGVRFVRRASVRATMLLEDQLDLGANAVPGDLGESCSADAASPGSAA